jgi:5-methylcytosine-specific restriction protein B
MGYKAGSEGSSSKEKERLQNHVLIIDEINRGNVAAIFGELITLLEPDKRLGEKEELTVTLPYSQESFGVPPNLYIIGTMNTADRSIEVLDIALRRRFHFVELMPDPYHEDIATDVAGVNVQTQLASINGRITRLIGRDFQIGHSYFIGCSSINDLKTVFENKVIPLLQEYFYRDYGRIGQVLGDKFVEEANNLAMPKPFGENAYEVESKVYQLKKVENWTEALISVYA